LVKGGGATHIVKYVRFITDLEKRHKKERKRGGHLMRERRQEQSGEYLEKKHMQSVIYSNDTKR
jgi:hypothetical protein